MNDSNKNGQPSAESREGSKRAEENAQRPRRDPARKRAAVSQGLEGVRQAARGKATGRFTAACFICHAEASARQLLRLKEASGGGS